MRRRELVRYVPTLSPWRRPACQFGEMCLCVRPPGAHAYTRYSMFIVFSCLRLGHPVSIGRMMCRCTGGRDQHALRPTHHSEITVRRSAWSFRTEPLLGGLRGWDGPVRWCCLGFLAPSSGRKWIKRKGRIIFETIPQSCICHKLSRVSRWAEGKHNCT